MIVTCAHTLCEHIGNGQMKCRHCGSIEPVVVATVRVKAEDYEALQKLYTDVRALMQAQTATGVQAGMKALGEAVGIPPKLLPLPDNEKELVLIKAVMQWSGKGFTDPDMESARDKPLRAAVTAYMTID